MTWALFLLFGGGITASMAARHGALAGPAVAARSDSDSDSDAQPPAPPRLDQELVTALYRVGLQPENLAAGGCSGTLADDVVAGVETWLTEHRTALSQADETLFTTRSNQDRLIRKVQSGLASAQEIADCQTAVADHTTANAARSALLAAAFDAGTAPLASEVKANVGRIKANGDAWNASLEFLVLDRTHEDWVHLRDALANERISAKYGEEPDANEQAYLATERAKPEVAAARTNLDQNLAAVRTAWEAAAAE